MSLLSIEGLGISFGGIKAVDDVSFTARPGEILSVIGPNGAGKTTLFNMISGVYMPGRGRVLMEGDVITGMPPQLLARRGHVANLPEPPDLPEHDGAGERHRRLSSERKGAGPRRSLVAALVAASGAGRARRRHALLERVGLARAAEQEAGNLSYGAAQAARDRPRARRSIPRILLLDEPAAGCNAVETEEIDHLIADLARGGISILLVEHDMKLVMRISSHIIVLDHGEKIAEGDPATVSRNPAVVAAYLGTEEAEHADG